MRLRYSKLAHNQTNKLLEHFVAGTLARTSALLVGVNRNSVNAFYHRLRVIIHDKLFADKHNHINGIENFWNQAKRHLRTYNGIPKKNFHLFLKECEWRFNYGPPDQLLIYFFINCV